MKLISKEICPVTVRDRLVKNLANQDINVMDMKKALEWAEEKCFELDKLCFKLTGENDYLIGRNSELEKELKFARRIILSASENSENKELDEYVDMLRREKLI